jgi:hypothetical protein
MMILNTGRFGQGALEEADIIGIGDWLTATVCEMSSQRQGFIANGDEIASVLEYHSPSLVSGLLGTGVLCSPYREPGCPPGAPADSSVCVGVIDADGTLYPSRADYYAFGNGCPGVFTYTVLYATGGVGNRDWWDYDGDKGVVSYAQVVNDAGSGSGNYRSVVDGYSYEHITTTFNEETDECVGDFSGIIDAAGNEIAAALDWIFDGSPPTVCMDSCPTTGAPGVGGAAVLVNRLYQNEPNPFNPRTTIRFSVAAKGPVTLSIYDVSGRLVKTLVSTTMNPGLHTIVWDGTDNAGHKAGSGIYWSQLRAGDYVSNKKMLLLK